MPQGTGLGLLTLADGIFHTIIFIIEGYMFCPGLILAPECSEVLLIIIFFLQLANPVSCARKGWVNVDVDLIACESCNAMLSFPIPLTWFQHEGKNF